MSKVLSSLFASSCLAALPADVPTVQINGVAGKVAFAAGYRHVDTAFVYQNQEAVGRGLKAANVARDEYFVTSKVPPGNATATAAVLETCLQQLGLEYVDLMLIHYNDPTLSSPAQRK